MRYTGIAVILIGACILLFTLVASVTTGGEVQPNGATARADMLLPIIMGLVALVIGTTMYLYGGRGIISTRNPAVRN